MASQAHNVKFFRPAFPDEAKISFWPEAATQSFKKGELVTLSSGAISAALATSKEALGVAAEDASGTTGNRVGIYARPEELFIGRASGGNAVDMGALVDYEVSSNACQINENAATIGILQVVEEYDTTEVTGSAGKQYFFRIANHSLAIRRAQEQLLFSGFFPSTVGDSGVKMAENMEFPRPYVVTRIFLKCQTAPGGAYVCTFTWTDGTNSETATITGSATIGEEKAGTTLFLADTDTDADLVDDNASGATADVGAAVYGFTL